MAEQVHFDSLLGEVVMHSHDLSADINLAVSVPITLTGDTVGIGYAAPLSLDGSNQLYIAADAIKDTHIDWGTGANQVSGVDLPIADSGAYYTGTEVETALQEIGAGTTLDSRYVNVPGDTMTGQLIISSGGLTVDGATVFNEAGADVDFRIESDAITHALFVQGSDGFVGVGQDTPTASLHVLNIEDNANVTIFNLEGKRPTPTNNDTMYIYYRMNNSTPASFEYARTTITAEDITAGGEEGSLLFEVARGGALDVCLKMSATEIVLNEAGADRDLRIEGDTEVNLLCVDAGNDRVGIGTNAPVVRLDVNGNIGLKSQNELRFYDNGNYVGFEAPALAADQIWVLPSADGNANEALTTDGAGTLSWAAGGSNWTVAGNVMQPAVDGDGVLIDVPTASREALILKSTDDNETKKLLEFQDSGGNLALAIEADGDLFTDRWLSQDSNFFLGVDVLGAGNLAHTTGAEGYYNVAIGNMAGEQLTTGYYNIFVGFEAGENNTTGSRNIMIGYCAGEDGSTGYSNIFIGMQAGEKVDAGVNESVGIGYRALQVGGGGVGRNVAIGDYSLGVSYGSTNVSIGYYAMRNASSGSTNLAIGFEAARNIKTGYGNVAMGYQSMRAANPGTFYYNMGLGYRSLYSITEGHDNAALGPSSLYLLTSGNFNTMVGSDTGRYITTGANNVAIGYRAGHGASGQNYSNNTIIGYRVGDDLTTGSNNILIGFEAGDQITTGSDNIIIGYNIDTSAVGASNELIIGSLIMGYLSAHASGPAIHFMGGTPQAQQAHIVDADGTLADVTAKLNTLLADLEGYGLLAAA